MNIIHIFVFAVLAAVAVLLARIAVRLWESRHNEERQLEASAHTVARLLSKKISLSRLLHTSFLTAILVIWDATALTSCSVNDDPATPQSTLSEASVGEWIYESSASDYVMTVIYHFYADGSCWKENDVLKEGKMVFQGIDRYGTYESTYTIDGAGNVTIALKDGLEEGKTTETLHFNGTQLTVDYDDTTLRLVRATDAQVKLYKEEADAWHGGADDDKKYNVADYKPVGVDNSQWMKQLKDSRLVCDLSLPGSHDACTAEGWNNQIISFAFELTAKCQDLTIKEQLQTGVRVFDLRPERDLDGKDWVLRCSHGIAGTKMYVSDFFRELKTFLTANPTEFCIVTIELSATKDKTAWGREFSALIGSTELSGLFADFKARLTVGEMRGKVLLLSKWEYATKPIGGYCYGWDSYLDLASQQQGYITAADGSKTPLWVQDYWKNITRSNKDQALLSMLEAAAGRDMTAAAPAWVVNFPSAYIDGPFSDNYRKNAESANKVAIDWLSAHTGSVGVIYMDFCGMDKSPDYTKTKLFETQGMKLIDSVIKQNWK
jgi:hypothetical protein